MTGAALPEIRGWRRTFHLKLRFGLAKLPLCPVRYRLQSTGRPDFHFWWTRVIPFMDPVRGAFDFALYGWDVRELRFLQRFLTPGMTFLDIGAHHGLYSVLASALVGDAGRVLAFEPSPAILRRLRWHVRLNRRRNVDVCGSAVGARTGPVKLFVPIRGIDTISSLRPPGVGEAPTRGVQVASVTLDGVAEARKLLAIDLIKVDVEGAESDVLDGATRVRASMAPWWMFEALDSTSAAWGSSGRALVQRFLDLKHEIFAFDEAGRLQPHRLRDAYPLDSNCNLLAVPESRRERVSALMAANPAIV